MSRAAARIRPERNAQAQARLDASGVPTRRIEEWKYSDLKAALGEPGIGGAMAEWLIDELPYGIELFDLSQPNPPAWVIAHFGASADNAMSAASLVLAAGGVALRVPAGFVAEQPMKLDFAGMGHVRGLLVLEDGASLTLVEGTGVADFRNVGFEIVLGANSSLQHVRQSAPAPNAVLVEEIALTLASNATYKAHFASFGGKLSRVELEIALAGTGAAAHLSGVSVLNGLHADVTTHVVHAVGGTESTQLFKHVATGAGRAVYQGKVTVAKGADGSDSRQTAKALLLGDRAEADLKPELEILADDVKCAHGAAVGDMDGESLFYLRARGIPEGEARRLLLRAFLEDALAEIADAALRDSVRGAVNDALEGMA
ncbi:MAG TPA: SufD family Fe-S cluster assembly protein [Rhizomicrobium sp.]|jgi:Fe-S cluster assembly protein SufD|nr:SufD family Fe-S cluster assembly protein [Rhizomicrobium sp.]